MKNLLKIIFALFLIISCEPLNSPGEPEYNYSILFNLIANKKNQEIFIYKVVTGDEQLSYKLEKYFVKNAQILIGNKNWNYKHFSLIRENTYFNQSKGFHYRNIDSLELLPNSNYNLEVNINGNIIKGTTTTPEDFEIISPKNGSILTYKGRKSQNKKIKIIWNKSGSAKGYIIKTFYSYSIEFNDSLYNISSVNSYITKDTTLSFNTLLQGKGILKLEVQAFDKNYYNHIIEKIPSVGIKGAYGYFGSSILKTSTILIK